MLFLFLFIGTTLQKKWKNIRSCFARETRRLKFTKSGSATSHKTPYIFYKQLLFLKNNASNLNTESNIEDQQSKNDEQPLGPYSRENIIGRKKKKASDDDSTQLLETLNKCIDTRQNREDALERDEDRMFLLSLLSSFKKIPEEKKAAAKIQLISSIDSFTYQSPPTAYPNTMWQNCSGYEYEQRRYYSQGAGSSTLPNQQPPAWPEAQVHYPPPIHKQTQSHTHADEASSSHVPPESRYFTLQSHTQPSGYSSPDSRPDSRISTATSGASQEEDTLNLF